MIKTLRPVGNAIYYKPKALPHGLFAPFLTRYYQSGTAALSATLIAAQQTHSQIKTPKVLLPAYACPDLISAAIYAKVEPVLIDLEPGSPWMQLEIIKQKIKTDPCIIAIVAVNFLGIPERIKEMAALINDNITLIEDSAQDLPTSVDDFLPHCDFIISSFGRGKPLGLLGGGIVLTKKRALYQLLPEPALTKPTLTDKLKYWLKVKVYNTLIQPFFYYLLSHFSSIKLGDTVYKPLTSIKACPDYILKLVSCNYSIYCKRKTVRAFYTEMLNRLHSNKIIDLVNKHPVKPHKPLLRYPLLVTDLAKHRALTQALDKAGLGSSVMYKDILPNINGITDVILKPKVADYRNAQDFAFQLITLPTHADVSKKDLKHIERIFKSIVN